MQSLSAALSENFCGCVRAGDVKQAALPAAMGSVLRLQDSTTHLVQQLARCAHAAGLKAEMAGVVIKNPQLLSSVIP